MRNEFMLDLASTLVTIVMLRAPERISPCTQGFWLTRVREREISEAISHPRARWNFGCVRLTRVPRCILPYLCVVMEQLSVQRRDFVISVE